MSGRLRRAERGNDGGNPTEMVANDRERGIGNFLVIDYSTFFSASCSIRPESAIRDSKGNSVRSLEMENMIIHGSRL